MKKPTSVKTLEALGRVQLSPSFFMRDFMYSEISQIFGIPNIPEHPDVAIEAGKHLCNKILEPIQARFGHITIRSAYRAPAVNALGAEKNLGCASNKANYAGHIWDVPDKDGCIGATACIVVNSFLPYYEKTRYWPALAWWIHDHIPAYSKMQFFPKLAAFNINWQQDPVKRIASYVEPKGVLTKQGMANNAGRHEAQYADLIKSLK